MVLVGCDVFCGGDDDDSVVVVVVVVVVLVVLVLVFCHSMVLVFFRRTNSFGTSALGRRSGPSPMSSSAR
jgi:hypothetical protein